MGFLGFGAIVVLLWYTGHQVIDGSLAIGTLTGFLLYGITIGASLASIAGLYGQFREGTGAVTRVFEILDTEASIRDAPDAVPLDHVAGRITLDHVTFGYREDRDVLRAVSLDVEPGEVLALVGPSGSGKTTLVALSCRGSGTSRSGTIRIDGHDIRGVTLASLRNQIGLVPQEATLFGGSIRDNIRYGRLDATEDEIRAASRAANADDFVTALPDGYETLVGDRGSRLSGGQRQRIAIARAILKDPPILLLDEATSSLDNESERLVQEALDRLKVGSDHGHRRAPPVDDPVRGRIAVLDDGWLVELGSHDELLAQDGLYARLYRLQFAEAEGEEGIASSVVSAADRCARSALVPGAGAQPNQVSVSSSVTSGRVRTCWIASGGRVVRREISAAILAGSCPQRRNAALSSWANARGHDAPGLRPQHQSNASARMPCSKPPWVLEHDRLPSGRMRQVAFDRFMKNAERPAQPRVGVGAGAAAICAHGFGGRGCLTIRPGADAGWNRATARIDPATGVRAGHPSWSCARCPGTRGINTGSRKPRHGGLSARVRRGCVPRHGAGPRALRVPAVLGDG